MQRKILWFVLGLAILALPCFADSNPFNKRDFWLRSSRSNKEYYKSSATLYVMGQRTLLFVEDKLTSPRIQELDTLFRFLEKETPGSINPRIGAVPLLEKALSPLPHRRNTDDRLIILIADLPNTKENVHFHPFDQLSEEEAIKCSQHSNEANILYVNHGKLRASLYHLFAREMQKLLHYSPNQPISNDPWLQSTLGEGAALLVGYTPQQNEMENYLKDPSVAPLVSKHSLHGGLRTLFASYLMDFKDRWETLSFLTTTEKEGREAMEEFTAQRTATPRTFDAIFSSFLGYLFENTGSPLPRSTRALFYLPEITPYIQIKSLPFILEGQLATYSFVLMELPYELPSTAIIQVEIVPQDQPENACKPSVLWKPAGNKRIAVYAVGCEHQNSNDPLIKFRLQILDRPFPL